MLAAQLLLNGFVCGFMDEEVSALVFGIAPLAGGLAAGQVQVPARFLRGFGDGATLVDESFYAHGCWLFRLWTDGHGSIQIRDVCSSDLAGQVQVPARFLRGFGDGATLVDESFYAHGCWLFRLWTDGHGSI